MFVETLLDVIRISDVVALVYITLEYVDSIHKTTHCLWRGPAAGGGMRRLRVPRSIVYPHSSFKLFSMYRYIDIILNMTHVSRHALGAKTSIRIKKNLIAALGQQEGILIESLLTPTETLMLAKRLALIVMLERGYSSYQIHKSLNMSISTIFRFEHMLGAGVFRPIQRILKGKKKVSLLELLELTFTRYGDAQHKKRLADIKRRLWAD